MTGIRLLSALEGSENTQMVACSVTTTEGMQASGLTSIFVPINTPTDACGLHVGTGVHGLFLGNSTNAGFEGKIKGQAQDITDAGVTIIGSTSGDSGSAGAVIIRSKTSIDTAPVNRGIIDFYNFNTKVGCVDKDGHIHSSCFCGGLAGNATTATNATNATNATSANNASCLGGQAAANYLRSNANDSFSGTLNYTPDTGVMFSLDGKAAMCRTTAAGGLTLGADDSLILGAGETVGNITGNVTLASEIAYLGGDSGVQLIVSPDNWASGWAGRHTASLGTTGVFTAPTLCASGTVKGSTLITTSSLCTSGDLSILNGGAAVEVRTGCLLTSNSYADASSIPACGIYAKGNICSAATIRATSSVCGVSLVCGGTVRSTNNCVGGILTRNSPDRAGLFEINRLGSCAWAGTQTTFGTAHWSLMGNQTVFGLYDDDNSKWAWCYAENGANLFSYNGTVRLCTSSIGGCFVGIGCSTTCHRAPAVCATTAFRTTGTGLRFCGGTGCGCAVDWIASSDARYKCNVVDYECGLDKINHLRPVCYQWKKSHQEDLGFIAQEVEEVEPLLVQGSDKSGYGLKYDKFAAIAVKAIQELSDEVNELKNEIKKLKNK